MEDMNLIYSFQEEIKIQGFLHIYILAQPRILFSFRRMERTNLDEIQGIETVFKGSRDHQVGKRSH